MVAQPDTVQAGGAMPPARPAKQTIVSTQTVPVWDLFIRIFHWSLVALFIIAFITGDEIESIHVSAGYAIAGLVVLRVAWGLIGSRHARFSDFVTSPNGTLDYMHKAIRGRAPRYLGHNPAGALMTLTLLGILIAISVTGYMMTTDAYWGAEWVENLHRGLVYTTLGLIVLHVAGVLATSFTHRENLVKAMITGRKRAP
jgi:cytochrome b